VAAVQFNHRALATLTGLAAIATIGVGFACGASGRLRRALVALGVAIAAQYTLGVATLLSVVQVGLATAHQAVAVLALTAVVGALHALRPGGRP